MKPVKLTKRKVMHSRPKPQNAAVCLIKRAFRKGWERGKNLDDGPTGIVASRSDVFPKWDKASAGVIEVSDR